MPKFQSRKYAGVLDVYTIFFSRPGVKVGQGKQGVENCIYYAQQLRLPLPLDCNRQIKWFKSCRRDILYHQTPSLFKFSSPCFNCQKIDSTNRSYN